MDAPHPAPPSTLIVQAGAALAGSRFEEALALAQQAWDEAADDAASAAAGAILCTASFRLQRVAQLVAIGDEVLQVLARAGRLEEQFDLLRYMATACSVLEQSARALGYAERSERLALALGGIGPLMLARSAMANCYFAMGNPWQAQRLLTGVLALQGAGSMLRERAIAVGNLGSAEVLMFYLLRDAGSEPAGRDALLQALLAHEECLAIGRQIDEPFIVYAALLNLAEVFLHLDRHDEAADHLQQSLALTERHGFDQNNHRRVAAELQLALGNVDQAVELGEALLQAWPQHPLKRFVHATLRDACRQRGDLAAALHHSQAAHRLDTLRLTVQLRAQSEYLVTRLEMEEAQRRADRAEIEAEAQRELANALELRVQERTAELREANTALRAEVAERRRAEDELRATQDELVRAGRLALLGQMSAAITHEISQPLTALRALSDNGRRLLQSGRGDEVDRHLKAITDITERMGRITVQLKTFARKTPPAAGSVRLGGAVATVLQLVHARTTAEGVELCIDVPSGLRVRCDGYQLEQVLLNLIANAIDAVKTAPVRRVSVSARRAGAHATVSVLDTGTGLHEPVLRRLFEPFFTTKPPGEGLGLGLVISSAIVREFGSNLRAHNLFPGAAFEFDLPLGEPAAREIHE